MQTRTQRAWRPEPIPKANARQAPKVQDAYRELIFALLAAQGWQVSDGRLMIGERTADVLGALTPLGQDARIAALHADVREVADRYLDSGHAEVAIFEAFKAINNRVKTMTGLDVDGAGLMGQAFKDSDPPITLADLSTETGRNIQAGFRFMFMGAVTGIRNPDTHELFKTLDAQEVLETLAFASMLMRRLDAAQRVRKSGGSSLTPQPEAS